MKALLCLLLACCTYATGNVAVRRPQSHSGGYNLCGKPDKKSYVDTSLHKRPKEAIRLWNVMLMNAQIFKLGR
jgi:hypothetical protein